MKKVVVVILNYQVKDLTIACVQSVKKSTYKNIDVVVVNNSIEEFSKEISDVIFIQNKENLGYTGGNNIGIKKALSLGADYIFILNPDTVIKIDTIEKLVLGLEKVEAGIVGSKIYFSDSRKIWYAGGVFNKLNVLGSHIGVNEEDHNQYDQEIETDYVTGAAMLVKTEVFESIGLFDERYFLYYEDSDFCFRAKRAGFNVMYIPQAEVFHANAKSTGLGSPLQDYFITRNRMIFAKKFLPFRTQFALFREAMKNYKNQNRRMAVNDFFIGKFGKGSFIKD